MTSMDPTKSDYVPMAEMVKEPNKSKSTICRICHKRIHDDERIKVYGNINAWGTQTKSYFHVECARATIGYDPTNEEMEQTTALIDLLAKLLIFLNSTKTRLGMMKAFIKENQEVWDKAEIMAKESEEK